MDAGFHSDQLQKHCRVCGGNLNRYRVKYDCSKSSEKLLLTFGITIVSDDKNIHPTEFCHSCFNVIGRCTKAKETKEPYQHTTQLFQWAEHSEPCFVCKHFTQIRRGGRRKKSHIGRPPKVNIHAAIRHIKSVAPESFQVSIDHSRINLPPYKSTINISDLKCPLCAKVVDSPVFISVCNNLVCSECCCKALEESEKLLCPCCQGDHFKVDFSHINKPLPLVMKLLSSLEVTCDICKRKILPVHIATDIYESHTSKSRLFKGVRQNSPLEINRAQSPSSIYKWRTIVSSAQC